MKRCPPVVLLVCLLALASFAQAQAVKARSAPAAKRAAAPALEPASPEQLEAAELVYYGPHDCADGPLDIGLDPTRPGYVDVRYGKTTYVMKPVLSTTGAIRLEDVKGDALLVQITAKSMLMDVQAGRRLADDCISERHRQAMREAAALAPKAAEPPR